MHADYQSIDKKGPGAREEKVQHAGSQTVSPKTRCMYASLYGYAQETEFGFEKGGQGSFDQRYRGDYLYPWGGAQPTGAFGCPRSGREGQRFARGPLSHSPGHARFCGCSGPKTGSVKIWCKKAKVKKELAEVEDLKKPCVKVGLACSIPGILSHSMPPHPFVNREVDCR